MFAYKKDKQFIILTQSIMFLLMIVITVYSFYQKEVIYYSWQLLDFNHINLNLSIQFDVLTKIMMIFILVIGFFIYRYACTYLESDKTRVRFLSQFNLVLVSVLLLVMAKNLLTAFVAWQFIGINMYLLLNHYHYDSAANRAAKKKFVINRIGDCCFLLAIILAYHTGSGASFNAIKSSSYAELICGLIFISVMTKCAQFPFHIWLIDTMETPTPVSALMHAGVINAGGILLTRISSSLTSFHSINYLILCIGMLSAILSIHWMQQQPDTKKKLAYSTMGQMGYMLTQCSLGAFPAAVFHLISHGFYKASLFLNSGETLTDKQQPENKPFKYLSILQSSMVVAVIFLIGLLLFKNQTDHIPLLMYGFIFFTLVSLALKINSIALSGWRLRGLYYIFIGILFFSYLYCFHLFSRLLPQYEYTGTIPLSVQVVLLLALALLQILLWTKKISTATMQFKDHTEEFLRRYLLNPLRAAGNIINTPIYRKIIPPIYVVTLCMVLFGLYFGLSNSGGVPDYTGMGRWFIFSFLAVGIIALIAANRCLTIRSLIAYLILFELAFINLAWFDGNHCMVKIGLFHLINISTALLMLWLLAKRQTPKRFESRNVNRLPTRVFYLTISLLLLIGIPGTASFISEFYLFSALMSESPLFILMYISLIVLIAIVVMHSLQLYVFNKNYTTLLSSPISKINHMVFILATTLNVVYGIYPSLLLNYL
ncbi:MAG: proton-conducting transporter membrane subunit [Coxiellaceae bacterium]|nr:proton-conducting transporter membrane subunit [Coxiellaceae bacterium]